MDIHEFLERPHRFRWGGVDGDDCMTFCATWAKECTGVDLAANLRGTYRTKPEAHAVMDAAGGALAFMDARLSLLGAELVQKPQDGDIGLIKTMIEGGVASEVGAIRFGPLWACIHPAGVRATKSDFIAAWRLPREILRERS